MAAPKIYDFVVADNAEPPHVSVYETSDVDNAVAVFWLDCMTLAQATQLAEVTMAVLSTRDL